MPEEKDVTETIEKKIPAKYRQIVKFAIFFFSLYGFVLFMKKVVFKQ